MSTPKPPSTQAALVQAFVDTAYIAECPTGQIEVAVGHLSSRLEDELGGKCFAFVTAWNPAGRQRDDAANLAQDRELVQAIDAHRLTRIPMMATSPTGDWFETGWLLQDVSRVTLDQWAHRFGQLGTLWWQRGHAVKLRVYAEKPIDNDNPFIDWIE